MFELLQGSRSRSVPIFLYDVEFGDGEIGRLRMTSAEAPVAFNGHTFLPSQVRHGDIATSGTLDKTTVELMTPRNNPLVELFRVYPPERVVNLIIYRGELDDQAAGFRAIWSGRVLNYAVEGIQATFSCEPIATSQRRPGLRRTYQYGCPHVLYGPQCRANKAAATVPATVTGIAGSVITLAAGWNTTPVENYLKGLVEWETPTGTARRTILQVLDGQNLLLTGVVRELEVGGSVDVVLGCNRRMNHCRDLHNNLPNYGGQPWIAKINPMGQHNVFY